jgi:predicted DNA-binding transcriptional regulator AlpA
VALAKAQSRFERGSIMLNVAEAAAALGISRRAIYTIAAPSGRCLATASVVV